jgi:hypothetical protein
MPRPHQLHLLHKVGRTRRCWVTGGTVAWRGRRQPRIHTAAHSPRISASLAAAAAAAALPAPSMQCLGEHRLRTDPACLHTGERAGHCTQPRSPQRAPPPRTLGILQEPANRATTARQHTHTTAPQSRQEKGGGTPPCAMRNPRAERTRMPTTARRAAKYTLTAPKTGDCVQRGSREANPYPRPSPPPMATLSNVLLVRVHK